jgi:hypothetical protein
MLEGIEDPAIFDALVPVANGLAALLPRVRAVCIRVQQQSPSDGLDIPASAGGALNDLHRALSRAGNALATAAEAAAMVRLGAAPVEAVHRRARIVHEHVAEAEELASRSGH